MSHSARERGLERWPASGGRVLSPRANALRRAREPWAPHARRRRRTRRTRGTRCGIPLASARRRMPRFQLLVRELGKPPRVVPLTKTITVGRSRRADLVLEDEEVGREQFRIGPEGTVLFVEGIGSTNRTVVDGVALEPGQR